MKTYDPLRMVVKQNGNERAAYNMGFDAGKEKAGTAYELDLVSWRDWLYQRIMDVEDIRDGNESDRFLHGMKPIEAYLAALADVAKIIEKRVG